MKRNQLREANGRWRKTTLKDFGIKDSDLNLDFKRAICTKCGLTRIPILNELTNCRCGGKTIWKEKC